MSGERLQLLLQITLIGILAIWLKSTSNRDRDSKELLNVGDAEITEPKIVNKKDTGTSQLSSHMYLQPTFLAYFRVLL